MKFFQKSIRNYIAKPLALWGIGFCLVLSVPVANAAGVTGCSVLFYYSPGDTNGATLSNLLTLLQGLGTVAVKTVPVGTAGASYDPTGDNWVIGGVPQYTQVWDCRFTTNSQNCSGYTQYGDYFNANWTSVAKAYLTAGGNFYLQGENAGYPSRYMGNDVLLRAIGVSASFTDCPWGNTSTDDDATFALQTLPSTMPGPPANPNFLCFQFGGIPVAYTNGTNFVTFSGPWNNSTATRAVVTGWTASQMTLGAGAGNLITCWDTTMWGTAYYPSATTDTFFKTVYEWLNGASCTTNTPTMTVTVGNTATQTSTQTATVTNTMSTTPTNTVTDTPVFTFTFTNTPTATSTATPANTNTPTNTATNTATFTPTNTPTPPLYAWPNPFNPNTGSGYFKVGYISSKAVVTLYTISGELVSSTGTKGHSWTYNSGNSWWEWNGRNDSNYFVSTGVYVYVVQASSGGAVLLNGKLLVINGK